MKYQEKALELLNEFKPHPYNGASKEEDERMQTYHAKQSALKALDVVVSFLPFTDLNTSLGKFCERQRHFIDEVKKELNKL